MFNTAVLILIILKKSITHLYTFVATAFIKLCADTLWLFQKNNNTFVGQIAFPLAIDVDYVTVYLQLFGVLMIIIISSLSVDKVHFSK